MENMTTSEDLLFFPVIGRIYTTERFPAILRDEKALSLKSRLPAHLRDRKLQNQYAALAGAVRSAEFDRFIRSFLKQNPDGIVVQLGCGLETTFDRCDNGSARWVEVDTAESMKIRKTVLREGPRERYFEGDPLSPAWMAEIRVREPQTPVLVCAAGLLHRFPQDRIEKLLWELQAMGHVEILFDALNRQGGKRMEGYLPSGNPAKTAEPFCVDDAAHLAEHLGGDARVLVEDAMFAHADLSGVGFLAKSAIRKANRGKMMKIVALKLS